MADTFYIATDQTGTFGVLRDQNGDPITDATLVLSIIDKMGVQVDPQPFPFPITFVPSGDGDGMYTCDVPHDHELVEKKYLAEYMATKSDVQSVWHGSIDVIYQPI